MKKPIWKSPNPNSWWRIHKHWGKDDIIKISDNEGAIERARQICSDQERIIKEQKENWFISCRNSYWRDPFPPFDWN